VDKLATNIVHFARTLRTAGLRVGPGQVLRAVEAVEAAGLKKRDDFYWTLHSVFVNRRDQREIFDQAFHVYWRNPRLLEKMMEMLLPQVGVPAEPDKKELSRRLQDALSPGRGEAPKGEEEPPEVEIEATFTVSDNTPGNPKFWVQLPTSITITRAGGGATMTVSNFTSNLAGGCATTLAVAPGPPGGCANSNQNFQLNIGGQLSVAAAQMFGNYTGTFQISVHRF